MDLWPRVGQLTRRVDRRYANLFHSFMAIIDVRRRLYIKYNIENSICGELAVSTASASALKLPGAIEPSINESMIEAAVTPPNGRLQMDTPQKVFNVLILIPRSIPAPVRDKAQL